MAIYRGYRGASGTCSGKAQKGCIELVAWFKAAAKNHHPRNDGIYNCRPVRGGVTPSVHSEGRAADLGLPTSERSYGWKLANALLYNSAELGIQCVIYDRKIWSGTHPNDGWRDYHGSNPHTTHLHVELSWVAARGMTAAQLRKELLHEILPRTVQQGSEGQAVETLKRHLRRHGYDGMSNNDKFGDGTEDNVIRFQRKTHLDSDGVVGRKTWRKLLYT